MKHEGLKEQVRKGALSPSEAMRRLVEDARHRCVDPECNSPLTPGQSEEIVRQSRTYRWLARRAQRRAS